MRNDQDKFNTVISSNTFYYSNREFEESYEGQINLIKTTLLNLKNDIHNKGLMKEVIEELIYSKKDGLTALLVLTGFSDESLKRLITFIRIVNDPELNTLVYRDRWTEDRAINTGEGIKEWTDVKIQKEIRENEYFKKGLVNLFFEGATVPIISRTLPLFELKKLGISKLSFDINDTSFSLMREKR